MQWISRSWNGRFKTKKDRLSVGAGGLVVVAVVLIVKQCASPVDRVVLATGVPGGGYDRLGKELQLALRGTLDVELLRNTMSVKRPLHPISLKLPPSFWRV